MKGKSYFLTDLEWKANKDNTFVPFQINCIGHQEDILLYHNYVRKDYYLWYGTSGSIKMFFKDSVYSLSAGDLIIFKPFSEFIQAYTTSKEKSMYYFLHFTGSECDSFLKSLSISMDTIYHIGLKKELLDLWPAIISEFTIRDSYLSTICESLLKVILCKLSRIISRQNNFSLNNSISYIHQYYKEKIEISQLSALEGVSDSHFRKLFKQTYKISPLDYIINLRISLALNLLASTTMSIREIAEQAGYDDPYYFSRIFKSKVGTSPNKYRRQLNS